MTNHHILVINAGSSSIKFAAFDLEAGLAKKLSGSIENILTAPVIRIKDDKGTIVLKETHPTAKEYGFYYDYIFSYLEQLKYAIVAVGHRVVHGGKEYHEPVIVTPKIITDLEALIPYAPLHQPYNVQAIQIIAQHFPDLIQVACFDTAFHWTHPKIVDMFSLTKALDEEGIRRYGFHGLSYEYINSQIKVLCPEKAYGRIIVAHLGNGASLCAIKEGKSYDSTMGFSTLDGLMMGTRPGLLDPGVLLYLMQFKKMDFQALQDLLYKKSGLLGISDLSNDMRALIDAEDKHPDAKTAVDLFVYRIIREFGALMSVMEGCELLVFTGGIGENAYQIRERVCDLLRWCGAECDMTQNRDNQPIISQPGSPIQIRVIPTNEELIIAQHTKALI